jgi:long-chain fatty acid transport protein
MTITFLGTPTGVTEPLPLYSFHVPAGFPSPAADHLEGHISLDELFDLRAPHVYLGTTWTRWSRLQKFEAVNSGVSSTGQLLGFGKVGESLNWHDTWSAAIGVSTQLTSRWLLRAGYAYDPAPVGNTDRSVRIPVGDRQAVTVGGAYSPDADLTIDFAYGYLWDARVSVKHENKTGLQPQYSAEYQNHAHGVSVQATYRF